MRRSRVPLAALAFGYAFLYTPIILLIVYSFNASRLVTVWAGFSPRWYGELAHNAQILDAAWLSLRVAAVSATLATLIGTLAALAIARSTRFPGRSVLLGLLAGPLVMPEVMLGLALLLLFVTLETTFGWPRRGAGTIVAAHATFSIAYVAVVVRAKLADMDRSLEEAAADLGAPPLAVFQRITMPLVAPALGAGWLLSFTLSLDDLVVASFFSGPGATTLPMVVYSSVRLGVSPQINALATILILTVALCVGTAAWLIGRRNQTVLH